MQAKQTARDHALQRFVETKKILDDREVALPQCEKWLVEAGNIRNEMAQLFFEEIESSALELVVNDISTQVSHNELPTAYEYLKPVLLTQEQKMVGLKSGDFRRNCLDTENSRSIERTIQKKVFIAEAIQRAKYLNSSKPQDLNDLLGVLSQLLGGQLPPVGDRQLASFLAPYASQDSSAQSTTEGKIRDSITDSHALSMEAILGYEESSFASAGSAMQAARSLLQIHYFQVKKILQAKEAQMIGEEQKFDFEEAAQIVSGVENILAALFSVVAQLLVAQQLESVLQAFSANNQDQSLRSKFYTVIAADGSLVSCAQYICLSLCSANGPMQGQLHKVAKSLKSLMTFNQLEALFVNENSELNATLKSCASLFTFANGAVAYRIFRETRNVVHRNSLLLQTSSSGRKIDPSRFSLRHKSARVAELETFLQQSDQVEALWVEGQASGSENQVLQQLRCNGMNEVSDMLTLAVKADPKISGINFVKRMRDADRAERMPMLKTVLAALVSFHPAKDQLLIDLQRQFASIDLVQLWATAGDIVGHLHNHCLGNQGQAAQIGEEFKKKADLLSQMDIQSTKIILQKSHFQDYSRSCDDLCRDLEEMPYEATMKRIVSFGIFKRALEGCDQQKQSDYVQMLICWFTAAMRSCNKTHINYSTGLGALSETLEAPLKRSFDGLISVIAGLALDTSAIFEALCWSYMPSDFQCLKDQCQIFGEVGVGRPWRLQAQSVISCEILSAISHMAAGSNTQQTIMDQLRMIGQLMFTRVRNYLDSYNEETKVDEDMNILQVIKAIDLLACLSKEKAPAMTTQIINQENLSLLLRLAIETTTFNQIITQSLIQNLLNLGQLFDDGFLNEAVASIDQSKACYRAQSQLQIQNSPFLQLLFNQTLRNDIVSAAHAETARTFKAVIATRGAQSTSENEFKAFLRAQLQNIGSLNEPQMEAILNLVPEMTTPKISTGCICIDQVENQRLTVVGYCKNSSNRTELCQSARGTDMKLVKGLSNTSNKTQILLKDLKDLKPLIGSSEEKLAKKSPIFHDAALLRSILETLDQQQSPVYRAFVMRGFSNMIRILTTDYISFLEGQNLIGLLVEKVNPIASESFAGLRSIEVLQQLAENIGKEQMEPDRSSQQQEQDAGPRPAIQGQADYRFSLRFAQILQNDQQKNDLVKNFFETSGADEQESNVGLSSKGIASRDQCLSQLGSLRAREILITILSEKPSLNTLSPQQLFRLIHDEHANAANSGYPGQQQETEQRILQILDYLLAQQPAEAQNFVTDLLQRGQLSIQMNFDSNKTNRSGSHLLHPSSLPFFAEVIQSKQLISSEVDKIQRALYDLMLCFGFGYSKDYSTAAIQLFKAAKKQLQSRLAASIASLSQADAEDLINNELIYTVFYQNKTDYSLLFGSKCDSICQIVDILKAQSKNFAGLEFKLSPHQDWIKIEDMFNLLSQGLKPNSLLMNIERDLLLRDLKARGVTRNWGSLTRSDDYIYDNIEMSMKVSAADEEKVLSIFKNFNDMKIKLKNSDGTEKEHKEGKKIIISPHEELQIEIVQSQASPSVFFSGILHLQDPLQADNWQQLYDSSELNAVKVYAERNWVIFVTEDEKIHMLGRKKREDYVKEYSDEDEDEDEDGSGQEPKEPKAEKQEKYEDMPGTLREITKPAECREFKKIVHINDLIVILTEAGKLFVHGYEPDDVFQVEDNDDGNDAECFKEVDISQTFQMYSQEQDGKIVDIDIGIGNSDDEDTIAAIVTEQGRLYAISESVKKALMMSEHDSQNGKKDYRIYKEVNVKKGEQEWKVQKVHCGRGDSIIWTTMARAQERKTFIIQPLQNCKVKNKTQDRMKELAENVVFRKVVGRKEKYFGIDEDDNLWSWGEEIYGLHEEERKDSRVALKCKYFSEGGLKIIDVQMGAKSTIIKTKSSSNETCLYGIPRVYSPELREYHMEDGKDIEGIIKQSKDMLGFESVDQSKSFNQVIYKLGFPEPAQVKNFACSSNCSFFVLEPADSGGSKDSDDLNNPPKKAGKGLLHYYRGGDGNWVELDQDQYNAQKEQLPPFCFATHYPIEDQRSLNYLTQINDSVILENVQEEAKVHENVRSTAKSEQISHDQPLYYSYTNIDDKEQRIYAKEDEVRGGDQIWDLNPLIFYRLKKPIQNLDSLPLVEIKKVYNQNRKSTRKIVIIEQKKNISDEDIQAAKQQADESTIEMIEEIRNFTPEDDLKILQVLDKQLQTNMSQSQDIQLRLKAEEDEEQKSPLLRLSKRYSAGQFDQDTLYPKQLPMVAKKLRIDSFKLDYDQYFSKGYHIENKNQLVIVIRAKLLLKLNKMFYTLFKIVNQENRLNSDSRHGKYFAFTRYVLPQLRFQILKEQLEELAIYEQPGDTELKCKVTINDPISVGYKQTSFSQMTKCIKDYGNCNIEEGCQIFRDFTRSGSQPFRADRHDVRLVDEGGGYRQLLTDVLNELRLLDEPLLRNSPLGIGTLILNDECDFDSCEDKYKLLGAILAFSFLSMQPFNIGLDISMWKQIVGQKLDKSDLEQYEVIDDDDQLTDSQIEQRVQEYFSRFSKQVRAIQQGMDAVLQGKFTSIAYLPIERTIDRISGRETYDMEDLKGITVYQIYDDEGQEKQLMNQTRADKNLIAQHKDWFWKIFAEFNDEEKALYLEFVWGRSRLPIKLTTEKHQFSLMEERKAVRRGMRTELFKKDTIPQSHTCFFQFELPFYSDLEKFKTQLLRSMSDSKGVED